VTSTARVAAAALAALAAWTGSPVHARGAAGPIVCVRYRGTPAGVPDQNELALVRALGFAAVLWQDIDADRTRELRRMAGLVDLTVITGADAESDRARWTEVAIPAIDPALIAARAWLAIADGARLISFETGAPTAAGLEADDGSLRPWVRPAVTVAREIAANAPLLASLVPGPRVKLESPTPAQVRLLDAGRAWVLIVANPARVGAGVVASLPAAVPYGPWVSLTDGPEMSMLDRRTHHEYRAQLAPGEARAYVIDKTQKALGAGR
jgi:hypothetical protein